MSGNLVCGMQATRGACRKAGLSNILQFEWSEGWERETMLSLTIAMGTVVWAMIGYALLSPNPPALEGTDADANI